MPGEASSLVKGKRTVKAGAALAAVEQAVLERLRTPARGLLGACSSN
jgi:hypothetical protein